MRTVVTRRPSRIGFERQSNAFSRRCSLSEIYFRKMTASRYNLVLILLYSLVILLYIICIANGFRSEALDVHRQDEENSKKVPLDKLHLRQRHKRSHKSSKNLEIENVPQEIAPLLDMSCMSKGFLKAPEIQNGKVARYARKRASFQTAEEEEAGRKGFLVVQYECFEGFRFRNDGIGKMFCSKGKWIGVEPKCYKNKKMLNEQNDDSGARDDEEDEDGGNVEEEDDYKDEDEYDEEDYKEENDYEERHRERESNKKTLVTTASPSKSTEKIENEKDNETTRPQVIITTASPKGGENENEEDDDYYEEKNEEDEDYDEEEQEVQERNEVNVTSTTTPSTPTTKNEESVEKQVTTTPSTSTKKIEDEEENTKDEDDDYDDENEEEEVTTRAPVDEPQFSSTKSYILGASESTTLSSKEKNEDVDKEAKEFTTRAPVDEPIFSSTKAYILGFTETTTTEKNEVEEEENTEDDYDGEEEITTRAPIDEPIFSSTKAYTLGESTTTATKIDEDQEVDAKNEDDDYDENEKEEEEEEKTTRAPVDEPTFSSTKAYILGSSSVTTHAPVLTTSTEIKSSTKEDEDYDYEENYDEESKITTPVNEPVVSSTKAYTVSPVATTASPVGGRDVPEEENEDENYDDEDDYEEKPTTRIISAFTTSTPATKKEEEYDDYDNEKEVTAATAPPEDESTTSATTERKLEITTEIISKKDDGVTTEPPKIDTGKTLDGSKAPKPEEDDEYLDYYDELEANKTKTNEENEVISIDSESSGCSPGFRANPDGTCSDLNECETDKNDCSHVCENTIGSYRCICSEGFEMINGTCKKLKEECPEGYYFNDEESLCLDVDECTSGKHNCSQLCINTKGSYFCSCPIGFILSEDQINCIDLDECAEQNNLNFTDNNQICAHACINMPGSFKCSCLEGYELHENHYDCQDIDECLDENGNCSHICSNTDGSFKCACPNDHFLSADNKTCIKSDPCLIDNGGCSDICHNDNGTPICLCQEGFEMINETCRPIDPCSLANGGCSHICTDYNGTPLCSCPDNYMLKGKKCTKINPCSIRNGGCSHKCSLSDEGLIQCLCPKNLELDGKICVQKDPCKIDNGGCSHFCLDINGTARCSCPEEHEIDEHGVCMKVNPCFINNGGYSHECKTENEQVICLCPDGYYLDGRQCKLIDPCSVNNGGCSHECLNIDGKAVCKCPPSYELINRSCFLIDPCLVNNGGCSHNCTQVKGQAKCFCPEGLQLRGKICLDDPCKKDNGGCSHHCHNDNGYRICSCPPGYLLRPNKRMCKKINGCKIDNGGCSHRCKNIQGEAKCFCPNGSYLGHDNKTCVKSTENCWENNGNCEQICRPHGNGRRCGCHEGYVLQSDGISCQAVDFRDCIKPRSPLNGKIKCLRLNTVVTDDYLSVGSQCIVWCDIGYKLRGESVRTCDSSGNWGDIEPYCIPIACPGLGEVSNGRLNPSTCNSGKTYPGERCSLECRPGYKPAYNLEYFTCLSHLEWSPRVSQKDLWEACVQDHPEPYIRCPNNGLLTYTLPPGQKTVHVTIPRPDTNVDWWSQVRAHPSWAMQLSNYLPVGRTEVMFTAIGYRNESTYCRLVVEVMDKEPPVVSGCPVDSEYRLLRNEQSQAVYWLEPQFSDNVAVKSVYKSREVGTRFGIGQFDVLYVAHDESGNSARCQFKITIKDADATDHYPSTYRAVLICPNGIQYMSKPPDQYNNNVIHQEGCHWSHVRVPANQVHENGYHIRSHHTNYEESSYMRRRKYEPFSLYNRLG